MNGYAYYDNKKAFVKGNPSLIAMKLSLEHGYVELKLNGTSKTLESFELGPGPLRTVSFRLDYSDVVLGIRGLRGFTTSDGKLSASTNIDKTMIIDTDSHQAISIESDIHRFYQPQQHKRKTLYLIDAYNHKIYPQSKKLRDYIDIDMEQSQLESFDIKSIVESFKPELIYMRVGDAGKRVNKLIEDLKETKIPMVVEL